MTPTVDELREVGLRPCASTFRLRVRYRANDRHGRIIYVEEFVVAMPNKVGQRTLGEYWRRRWMVDVSRVWHEWIDIGDQPKSQEDFRAAALADCRARRWQAFWKPGWKR